jgi:hypothetical protein
LAALLIYFVLGVGLDLMFSSWRNYRNGTANLFDSLDFPVGEIFGNRSSLEEYLYSVQLYYYIFGEKSRMDDFSFSNFQVDCLEKQAEWLSHCCRLSIYFL